MTDPLLDFDPFEGDFGEGEIRERDSMVKTRKPWECHHCHKEHPAGDRARSITEIVPGTGRQTYRWCIPCLEALSKEADGGSGEPGDDEFASTWTEEEEDLLMDVALRPGEKRTAAIEALAPRVAAGLTPREQKDWDEQLAWLGGTA